MPAPHPRRSVRVAASATGLLLASLVLVVRPAPAAVPPDGLIESVAGDGLAGFAGDGGPAVQARLSAPRSVAVDGLGALYVADTGNHRIRRVAPDGTITTIAGTGEPGYSGDGGPAMAAQLDSPHFVSVDGDGNVYIADSPNHRIRRIDPAGTITTVAGSGVEGFAGDGGPATEARLNRPKAAIPGPGGVLYIADTLNHRVRMVAPGGVITTIAGTGVDGHSGDGGPATGAAMRGPRGLSLDTAGNLFVADNNDARVRRISTAGIITTVAGSGIGVYGGDENPAPDYDGDGVPATEAALSDPRAVAVDGAGNVYIADSGNDRVRVVTSDGTIWTAAGTGTGDAFGDGGAAIYAAVDGPRGLITDTSGDLYIADTFNHRIRKVSRPRPAPPSLWTGDALPAFETEPVAQSGDSADDPAVWVDRADPSRSIVIGTDKTSEAIEVYDLTGKRIQRIVDGWNVNNVDVRTGFSLAGEDVDLVGAVGPKMRFYRIDPATRTLTNVTRGGAITTSVGGQGFCMYKSPATGKVYAFPNNGEGMTAQFELYDDDGLVNVRLVRGPWDVHPGDPPAPDGEVEGCVADDGTARFYISEHQVGVWSYGAEPADGTGEDDRFLLDSTDAAAGGHLTTDVEGLAVVDEGDGGGFLVASSQGDNTYTVYRREAPHTFVRKLSVADAATVDGCSRTDGIETVTGDLGPAFPRGLFVCQDNTNSLAGGGTGFQNFKLVPLEQVVPLGQPDPLPWGSGGSGTTTTTTAPSSTTTTSSSTSSTTTTSSTATTTTTSSTTTTTVPAPTTTTTAPAPPITLGTAGTKRSGYWMAGRDGAVYAFGDAQHFGGMAPAAGHEAVDLEPLPGDSGYWIVDDRGQVAAFGAARSLGEVVPGTLAAGEEVTSLSATPTGEGYWIFTSRGRVLPFGDAWFYGDMSGVDLNGPVLDSIPTPTGRGYYMVASDGGIFSFGDAAFFGSMGGTRLNAPVQSLVPDGDGRGYWLVASDGGVFAFDAPFKGSLGGLRLNRPVTGMVRFGDAYLMVGEDGGIFNFSNLPFHGSLGADPPSHPVVAVAALG